MRKLKEIPFVWGFVISLLGSLPIGYLNLLACQLYRSTGIFPLSQFVLGIVLVEVLVVIATFRLVGFIESRWPIQKHLRMAAVIYLLLLALLLAVHQENDSSRLALLVQAHPLYMGLLLSVLNPLQIIFWLGWNAYLQNKSSLPLKQHAPFSYYLSTALGTVAGMFAFVFLLNALLNEMEVKPLYFNYAIAAVVIFFAIMQGMKWYRLNKRTQQRAESINWESS